MNYLKTFSRITLIAWSTIAVILVMCSITLHSAKANSLFKPPVNYGAGGLPHSVAIGDLDGDGDLDMAVANGGTNDVSVLLGNGDGTFMAAVNYDIGGGINRSRWATSMEMATLDLAVANRGPNDVSVLLGNGDGTFMKRSELPSRWRASVGRDGGPGWRRRPGHGRGE